MSGLYIPLEKLGSVKLGALYARQVKNISFILEILEESVIVLLKEDKKTWCKKDYCLNNEESVPFIFNIIMEIACPEWMLKYFFHHPVIWKFSY